MSNESLLRFGRENCVLRNGEMGLKTEEQTITKRRENEYIFKILNRELLFVLCYPAIRTVCLFLGAPLSFIKEAVSSILSNNTACNKFLPWRTILDDWTGRTDICSRVL